MYARTMKSPGGSAPMGTAPLAMTRPSPGPGERERDGDQRRPVQEPASSSAAFHPRTRGAAGDLHLCDRDRLGAELQSRDEAAVRERRGRSSSVSADRRPPFPRQRVVHGAGPPVSSTAATRRRYAAGSASTAADDRRPGQVHGGRDPVRDEAPRRDRNKAATSAVSFARSSAPRRPSRRRTWPGSLEGASTRWRAAAGRERRRSP